LKLKAHINTLDRMRTAASCSWSIGRIVGGEALTFGGWQRLNAEYAKQFGIEATDLHTTP